MVAATIPKGERATKSAASMKAAVFHAPGDIRIDEVARPTAGPGEAIVRVTLPTICSV